MGRIPGKFRSHSHIASAFLIVNCHTFTFPGSLYGSKNLTSSVSRPIPTVNNLNTLPELLLLGGGVPIWKDGELVGSIGVSGAGGGENDHNVAKRAAENLGFTIVKK